jgi:16S rRNA (guanine527-N7)-methyltransferase
MNQKRPRQQGKKHQGIHAEGRKGPPSKSKSGPKQGSKSQGSASRGQNTPQGPKKPNTFEKRTAATGPKQIWKPGSKPAARPGSKPGGRPPKPWNRDARSLDSRGFDGRSEGSEQKPRFAPPSRDSRHTLPKNAPRSTTPRPGTANARQVWGHTAPPSRGRLEELLNKHGVTLPGSVLDKVWQYHGILRRNNGDLDLTRLIGFETIVQRHYADCLILHKMMKGKWPSPLVDIGTGAGFPGLMIKIASPETEMILSEPRNVRVDYLNNTITEMGLKDISVFGHKFTSKSFQTPVRGVITRAFEPINKTLPRLQYSLQVGGLAMFMKGPGVDEELAMPLPSNYKLVRDERYRIPATTLDRAFVVFERIK